MFKRKKVAREQVYTGSATLSLFDKRVGVKVLKYKRKRKLKEPVFGGIRWEQRHFEKLAVKEGRLNDQSFNNTCSGGITLEYNRHKKVVNAKRAFDENPTVQKWLRDARRKNMSAEEISEIEATSGDFLEWARRAVRSKKFKQMIFDAAKTDNKVLLRLAEFAVGKPVQSLMPPVGNGKLLIAWESEVEDNKLLSAPADEPIIDVSAVEEKE